MLQLRPYQQTILDALRVRLRQVTHPLLVNASVGSGKSIIIANLLHDLQRANWRALCLTLNSELIRNNCETYRKQFGHASIFCAGLGELDAQHNIVFASPHSLMNAIKEGHRISCTLFHLIVVDEAHSINFHDNNTMLMRIINHYALASQAARSRFRVVGLTGTPFRGKGNAIVGPDLFFKEQVCEVTAHHLISQGYLVPPQFGLIHSPSYNFSKVRIKSNGKFDQSQVNEVVDSNKRLTHSIMLEVASLGRSGTFIFATSRKHCLECLASLPPDETAIIIGETPESERTTILEDCRNGKIRYLISVNCVLVGVDIPLFDTVVWVRPTESLVLYVQGIGRGLRLHPSKSDCLVLDYAGNLERHGDIDDPIINEALQPKELDNGYCIRCYHCNTLNKVTTRRCIGMPQKKRCDYYFEFKPCPRCSIENDKVARECRCCGYELIDPNAKLKQQQILFECVVQFWNIQLISGLFYIVYTVKLSDSIQHVTESYNLQSVKGKNIFYANFCRKHIEKPSKFYMNPISNFDNIVAQAKMPSRLIVVQDVGSYKIRRKIFL